DSSSPPITRHGVRIRIPAKKIGVQPQLGLKTQKIVHTCEDNNDSITGVCRPVYYARVVSRLARLNVSHDKPAPIPRSLALWIIQKFQHARCTIPDLLYRPYRPIILLKFLQIPAHEWAWPPPVSDIPFGRSPGILDGQGLALL